MPVKIGHGVTQKTRNPSKNQNLTMVMIYFVLPLRKGWFGQGWLANNTPPTRLLSGASIYEALQPPHQGQLQPVRLLRCSWLLDRAAQIRKLHSDMANGLAEACWATRRISELALPRRQDLPRRLSSAMSNSNATSPVVSLVSIVWPSSLSVIAGAQRPMPIQKERAMVANPDRCPSRTA